MLRTIRLTTAIVCFTLITLLFLYFTGRMVGENSISAGFISLEHRCRIVFSCTYIPVRTYLLLCYLSVGSVSGHCFVGIRQTKEKPVPLFTSNEMVAVWRFRSIHYYDGCRIELFGYLAGTV